MRSQEVACFCEALPCSRERIEVFSLLDGAAREPSIRRCDAVLLGGSGDHSVVAGGPWMSHVMETMVQLHARAKPTFASCWGFQAMAKALGGEVSTDPSKAELGSVSVRRTEDARSDPVFGGLPDRFHVQAGHQDTVIELPEASILLASSDRARNQAFRFRDKPIYCTQFHPELSRIRLVERLRAYPQYIESIAQVSIDEFVRRTAESVEASTLLSRFVEAYLS